MFLGLMSACTMPRRCSVATHLATSRRHLATLSGDRPTQNSREIISCRERSARGITMHHSHTAIVSTSDAVVRLGVAPAPSILTRLWYSCELTACTARTGITAGCVTVALRRCGDGISCAETTEGSKSCRNLPNAKYHPIQKCKHTSHAAYRFFGLKPISPLHFPLESFFVVHYFQAHLCVGNYVVGKDHHGGL